MITKILIFYFSGTGNSKRISLWLKTLAKENGVECQLQNIAKIESPHLLKIDCNALIVFISPIHGFNYPKVTLDFIRHFPKGSNNIVLMNTRAGMKIGNWVTPGITGIAFFISSIWLRNKGYQIAGQIPYDMPSNWISLHPALNQNTVKYIHQTIYKKVNKHFFSVIQEQPLFLSRYDIIQDILVAPISLLYYFIGRFFIAKTFYASHKCDNCGNCIKNCPVSAIKQIGNKPFWTVHCESCMRCMNFCPQQAIETSYGLLFITFIFYTLIIWISNQYLLNYSEINGVFRIILSNVLFFILLLILYNLQHFLLQNNILAKIIAHTSITYYKFWGRYRSISDKLWK